jgi:hypothetical protein
MSADPLEFHQEVSAPPPTGNKSRSARLKQMLMNIIFGEGKK